MKRPGGRRCHGRNVLLISSLISIGLLVGIGFLFLSPPSSSSSSSSSSSLSEGRPNNHNNKATATTNKQQLRQYQPDNKEMNRRWDQYNSNRSIALVHIGKSGGLTLRAMTSLKCRLPRNQVTTESIQSCVMENFGGIYNDDGPPVLALQTIYYAHMRSIPPKEMKAATSWLIPLRNPIDRVMSAYQYSHPANCIDVVELFPNSTKGCTNYHLLKTMKQQQQQQQQRRQQQSQQQVHKIRTNQQQQQQQRQLRRIFVDCFPQADMELFVTKAISSDNNDDDDNNCSKLARDYILGRGPIFPIPHLFYNYRHYQTKVLDPYDVYTTNTTSTAKNSTSTSTTTTKEWFGIRTEHLWDDYVALNRQLGGGGGGGGGGSDIDNNGGTATNTATRTNTTTATTTTTTTKGMIKLTHGSENYRDQKSIQLTTKTYEGLCCLLMDEIVIYLEIVQRIWNWNKRQKVTTFYDLAQKCGIILLSQQQQQQQQIVKAAVPQEEESHGGVVVMETSSSSSSSSPLSSWDQLWEALDTWKQTTCGSGNIQ